MMTCKDIENRLYPGRDKERMGSRNLVADMLHEVADSIGFNIEFLKENFNKNKSFQFIESDYDKIKEFMEIAKSPEGKRLRCKDYAGATGYVIDKTSDFYLLLAEHNGVESAVLREQWLKICVHTKCEIIRCCIREMTDEFEEDIDNRFFVTPCTAEDGFTDDCIPEIAKFVFLEFISGNIDWDISVIRGTYWFFKMKYESMQFEEMKKAGDYLRSLSAEQMEQLKRDIHSRLKYEDTIEKDEDLVKMTEEWIKIEEGQGRLKDIKIQKKRLEKIMDRRNSYVKNMYPNIDKQIEMPEFDWEEEVSFTEQCIIAYNRIFQSYREYKSYQAYRKKNPRTDENEMLMEIEFRQRFKTNLFPT